MLFRRKAVKEVHLTPLQKGLMKAVSLNYYKLDPVQEESVDRMRDIGLLRVEINGTILPTETGKGIIDGSIKTNDTVLPFVAGLI